MRLGRIECPGRAGTEQTQFGRVGTSTAPSACPHSAGLSMQAIFCGFLHCPHLFFVAQVGSESSGRYW
jgi:hypothetical protein